MKIGFLLEHEDEKVTNLNLADAILKECAECNELDAEVIAKAMLLEVEREARNERT